MESAIESDTQKQTDKNVKSFINKLGIKAEIKAFKDAEDKLKKFIANKESYEETRKAIEKLPKYKVIKDLELLEEQARNVLYSGRDIMQVWKHLGMTFKTSGVPVAAPKEFLQIESK
jgi:hypothetical protein